MIRNIAPKSTVNNSATATEIQIPSSFHTRGSSSRAGIWNRKTREKERIAEMKPLFNAVKKEETKIENPAKRKLNENRKNP